MASFKNLIFIALAVYAVSAEDGARVKKQAYFAAAPAPVLAYSAAAPAYSYSSYSNYPASYTYKYAAPAAYVAPTAYAAPAAYVAPAAYAATPYAAYPSYAAYDDGKYYPGKYEKSYFPVAYKAAYPVAYHY